MKKITTLLAILFIVSSYAQKNSADEHITLEIGNRYKIQSSILKEERSLLIRLPKGYDDSKKEYPVIYVLDGNNHFYHATIAATTLEENERMPESIIVAIPNNPGTRRRDLARGRANFKLFIKNEVIQFVEKKYRTTNHRTIFGHSMAGAFVLNYLATDPSLFENYIAASPVIQIMNSELLVQFEDLFKSKTPLNKSLYFTLTGIDAEGERATEALTKFVALLKKDAPKSLAWKYDYIENQIHMTTPYLTMYQGLSTVFSKS
jgi:predicted alpha/beta superfamily hydrolase